MSHETYGWYKIDNQQVCVLFHLYLACLCGLMQLPCPSDTLSTCRCVFVLPLSDTPPPTRVQNRDCSSVCLYVGCLLLFAPVVVSELYLILLLFHISCPELLFSSPFISFFFFLLLIPSCYQLGTSWLGQSSQRQHSAPLDGLICPQRIAPERIPLLRVSVLWSWQSNF